MIKVIKEVLKLYCKYFNENGHIGRDYGPCSFKIMNDNSYSEENILLMVLVLKRKNMIN